MVNEVISVINFTQGARLRWKFVYQIYPPAIDTLVSGMVVGVDRGVELVRAAIDESGGRDGQVVVMVSELRWLG